MDKTKKTQHGAAKKRKAAHRVFALLISALVVIGIAFAAVLIIKRINTVARKKSLPIRPETEYAYTGDGFVYIEGKTLNFYSVKNEDKNYSMSVEADNVKLVGTDKIKVIYNSSSIQIIGTRFDNMLNGELKKIVCGDKYVAVYLKNENGTHSLRAFNSSGTQCWQRDFSTTCITDFGFESSDSPVLWMSELSTVGNSFSTSILLYDLSRESVIGIISVQQQIVKNVFITKKSIFAFCTDYLIRFDRGANAEAYRVLCYGYDCLSADLSGGRMYLLLDKTPLENSSDSSSETKGVGEYRILSVSESRLAEEASCTITKPENVVYACMMRDRISIIKNNQIDFYGINGKLQKSYFFDSPVDSAVKLDNKNILTVSGSETALYNIR